ncbi:hypothetical protein IKQ21_06460, partial [bacterium]|nr:hypothetical protein [bacterium]
ELVNYMASQFGFAPYYTLSDTDFTLPMGEVYGFIGKNSADIKMLGAEKADKTALDDEWIYADETGDANLISTDYAIGTYDVNLSSILPSDGKIYECIFCYCISRNDNSNDNTTYKVTSNGHKVLEDNIDGRGGSSSDNKQHGGQFTAIVGLERKLQLSIINHVLHNGDTCMYISAYRKLGTN